MEKERYGQRFNMMENDGKEGIWEKNVEIHGVKKDGEMQMGREMGYAGG